MHVFSDERDPTVLELGAEDAAVRVEDVELLAVDLHPAGPVGEKPAAQSSRDRSFHLELGGRDVIRPVFEHEIGFGHRER